MSEILFDTILASFPVAIQEMASVTPRGKLLLSGLTISEVNQARAIATKVAVADGFVLGFKVDPWGDTPLLDLAVSVVMTREELMARFAAMTPEAQEIVMQAARAAREAAAAGDTRPAIEITLPAVREALKASKGSVH